MIVRTEDKPFMASVGSSRGDVRPLLVSCVDEPLGVLVGSACSGMITHMRVH